MTAGNSADGFNQEASGVTSISSTGITVGSSASLLVGVLVFAASSGSMPTSLGMTWNGVTMAPGPTIISQSGAPYAVVAIFALVNPVFGTKTLQGTWTNAQDCYMSAISFTGTDTTTGIQTADNTTATQTTSITVPSSADGATVAVFAADGAAPTVNFNKIFSEAPLNPGGGASYQLGGASNAHTFTGAGGTRQALVGVHIIAAAVNSGNPRRLITPSWLLEAA